MRVLLTLVYKCINSIIIPLSNLVYWEFYDFEDGENMKSIAYKL